MTGSIRPQNPWKFHGSWGVLDLGDVLLRGLILQPSHLLPVSWLPLPTSSLHSEAVRLLFLQLRSCHSSVQNPAMASSFSQSKSLREKKAAPDIWELDWPRQASVLLEDDLDSQPSFSYLLLDINNLSEHWHQTAQTIIRWNKTSPYHNFI